MTIKKKPRYYFILLLGCTSLSCNAELKFSGFVRAVTDYLYRGYTKSDGFPTVQANIDIEDESGFYLGTWLSMVNFDRHGLAAYGLEIIPYVGFSYPITSTFRFDTIVQRYIYNNQIYSINSNYNEYYFLLSYRNSLTAKYSFSEDYLGRSHPSHNYEINYRHPINDKFNFSAGLGYNDAKNTLEYSSLYWNLGVTVYLNDFAFDLRYYRSDYLESLQMHQEDLPWDHTSYTNRITFSVTYAF